MPKANTQARQPHPREISRTVGPGRHAVLLLDRAGWHTTPELKVPENITPLFLPAKAPEPNPTENIWQYPRQTPLSNRVFASHDAILDAACEAWNRLLNSPGKITSIGLRDWAQTGRSH